MIFFFNSSLLYRENFIWRYPQRKFECDGNTIEIIIIKWWLLVTNNAFSTNQFQQFSISYKWSSIICQWSLDARFAKYWSTWDTKKNWDASKRMSIAGAPWNIYVSIIILFLAIVCDTLKIYATEIYQK